MTLALTKVEETTNTLTLAWTPVPGAVGYRFTREKAPLVAVPSGGTRRLYSHTYDPLASSVKFSKDSDWYRVEPLDDVDKGEWPPPVSPVGLPLDSISDFRPWGGSGHLHADKISEISTPHGPGFKMVCDFPSGSGDGVQIIDADHLVDRENYLGTISRFAGKFMFPQAGNPSGFPGYGDWNCLWEFCPGHPWNNQIGVDGNAKRLYVRSYKAGLSNSRLKALGPDVEYDHWYSFDWEIRWSEGSSGFARFVCDGEVVADWTGPTQPPGNSAPWIQMGFYSGNVQRNEVHWADLRKL